MKFVVKEWQFSDGSHSLNSLRSNSQRSLIGSSSLLSKTGRKLKITVVEAKDLAAKDKSEKLTHTLNCYMERSVSLVFYWTLNTFTLTD